ncbi:Peptidase C14 caspase catalytic subunit p20 (fragment) [Methylocella tundrae]
MTDLNKATALNPRSAIALDFRGDAYLAGDDANHAIADFNEALRIQPDFVAAYAGRGQAYEKTGADAKAKTDYEKAISLPGEADVALARPAQQLARARLAALAEAEATHAKMAAGVAVTEATNARAKAEADARAKADAEKEAAAIEARVKAEVEARTKAAADAFKARLETQAAADARARADADAKAKSEFEARAKAEFEARVKAEVEARAKAVVEAAQAKSAALIPPPGNRVALVIGNSNYREVATLPNPERDAEAVAAAFRKIGFQTVFAERDLTREKFLAALRAFEDKAENADWAVVYYAGHGIEIGGVNYLIPVDAKLRADRDVQDEAITLDRVLLATERAKKLRLVILDACRNNPFLARMQRTMASRSIGRGFARVEPEGGTLVAYSARDGQVAQDGDGAHSPFTQALLRNIVRPQLEINMLFRQVRDEVRAATNDRQEPFTYGSLPGESFYFVAK